VILGFLRLAYFAKQPDSVLIEKFINSAEYVSAIVYTTESFLFSQNEEIQFHVA
jgi:hypothetical protein